MTWSRNEIYREYLRSREDGRASVGSYIGLGELKTKVNVDTLGLQQI